MCVISTNSISCTTLTSTVNVKHMSCNIALQDGAAALHLAAMSGHPSTVQLLLQKGADIDVSNSVLHIAYPGNKDLIESIESID